jgi:hypothetical protein
MSSIKFPEAFSCQKCEIEFNMERRSFILNRTDTSIAPILLLLRLLLLLLLLLLFFFFLLILGGFSLPHAISSWRIFMTHRSSESPFLRNELDRRQSCPSLTESTTGGPKHPHAAEAALRKSSHET